MTEHARNEALARLRVAPIAMPDAKRVIVATHYMRTFPQGARVAFGVFDGTRVVGVAVFGHSSATEAKVAKLAHDLQRAEFLEMQRLWVSDEYGHSTESFVLARMMRLLRDHGVKLIVTHAGGCKNDCGIVYQASAWLYFGSEPCRDFFLTAAGEYKSLVGAMRFGRVSTKGKTQQQVGEELFGPGRLIDSRRYLYAYPTHKGIRRRLSKLAQPYPKESEHFRRGQEWVS